MGAGAGAWCGMTLSRTGLRALARAPKKLTPGVALILLHARAQEASWAPAGDEQIEEWTRIIRRALRRRSA